MLDSPPSNPHASKNKPPPKQINGINLQNAGQCENIDFSLPYLVPDVTRHLGFSRLGTIQGRKHNRSMARMILFVAEWSLEVHTRTEPKWIRIQHRVIVPQEVVRIAVCSIGSRWDGSLIEARYILGGIIHRVMPFIH